MWKGLVSVLDSVKRKDGGGGRGEIWMWGGGGVGSAGIDAMLVRVGGARMRKGDVCFRGRRCAGHLKISFVAAEKKKRRKRRNKERNGQ